MISKKLFFSPAMCKNNIKRFKWGSFLYALFLFFSVAFPILVTNFESLRMRYIDSVWKYPLILREGYIIIPVLLALVVPTVAAVLIFNNVHSVKQSIFVHSLPVKRGANYVSDVFSGLLLMAVPVIVNGIVLMIMSFTKYGELISSSSVAYWVGINLAIIFIMFSFASATAFVTGHAAAHIGINVFVHILPLIIALTIAVISEEFLYGFMSTESFIAQRILNNTPIVWLFTNTINFYPKQTNIFSEGMLWVYFLISAIVYFLGYLLYKSRKIELSGDVAAFRVFRPIFKYGVTAAGAFVAFSLISQRNIAPIYMYVEIFVVTAIIYFACEILMNKSFRVFDKYKGFLVFAVCFALFIGFFAYTSVFGYETRVPSLDAVESASFHTYREYNAPPRVADGTMISATKRIHEMILEDIPKREKVFGGEAGTLYLTYNLKDGGQIRRRYTVSKSMYDYAMGEMYKNEEYKLFVSKIGDVNIENVKRLNVHANISNFNYQLILLDDDAAGFMRAIEKDIRTLSWKEFSDDNSKLSFNVDIGLNNEENEKLKIFKDTFSVDEYVDLERVYYSFSISINSNFKNAIEFLEKSGHYGEFIDAAANAVWICKDPVVAEKEEDAFVYAAGEKAVSVTESKYVVNERDCVRLYSADGRLAVEKMIASSKDAEPTGVCYVVFLCSNVNFGEMNLYNNKMLVPKDDVPAYLAKYLGGENLSGRNS